MRQVRATRPFVIEAMVVLPDHLHCIWRLPAGDADFSSRWREIKKAASRLIAPASDARRERAVWQRRFWEHAIRDADDWRRHVDYIHFNPVKHGLARHAADWRWSSFRDAVARGWSEASWGEAEPADLNTSYTTMAGTTSASITAFMIEILLRQPVSSTLIDRKP